MSRVYVGPYFRVKSYLTEVATDFRTCSNDSCVDRGSLHELTTAYCPKCGGSAVTIKRTKSRDVNPFTVTEEMEERMHAAGANYGPMETGDGYNIHIYLPNIRLKNPALVLGYTLRNFYQLLFESFITPIDEFARQAECVYLTDNFGDEFRILQKHYGEKNVTLEWGIVSYLT